MTTKHTPGPWKAPSTDGIALVVYAGDKIKIVQQIEGDYVPHEELEHTANTNLIAAAPDMLAALELCRKEIDAAQNNMIANGYEKHAMALKMLSYASLQAAEAIAKARGQA